MVYKCVSLVELDAPVLTEQTCPWKKGRTAPQRMTHQGTNPKTGTICICICFGRWSDNSGVLLDRPHPYRAGTGNSVIHRQRQADMTLDFGKEDMELTSIKLMHPASSV